jgi:hypothetical protein
LFSDRSKRPLQYNGTLACAKKTECPEPRKSWHGWQYFVLAMRLYQNSFSFDSLARTQVTVKYSSARLFFDSKGLI